MKNIPKLHFITHPNDNYDLEKMILLACKSGVPCIQLRMKESHYHEVRHMAKKAREITSKYNTALIINDYADIAKAIHADGVHLGNSDMNHEDARKLLGDTKIIGATANNRTQLARHLQGTCDYIGYGPYKNTFTKKNAAEPLGIDAYTEINHTECITKPIIAIGGITIEDIPLLKDAGIYGFALSSAILQGDMSRNIEKILQLLNI